MGKKARKPATEPVEEPGPHEGAELPERWSVQRKTELVLRLLRGEALDAVSRDSQVPAHELEGWKRVFLETGARGLKSCGIGSVASGSWGCLWHRLLGVPGAARVRVWGLMSRCRGPRTRRPPPGGRSCWLSPSCVTIIGVRALGHFEPRRPPRSAQLLRMPSAALLRKRSARAVAHAALQPRGPARIRRRCPGRAGKLRGRRVVGGAGIDARRYAATSIRRF
jgi:hypothetical protein